MSDLVATKVASRERTKWSMQTHRWARPMTKLHLENRALEVLESRHKNVRRGASPLDSKDCAVNNMTRTFTSQTTSKRVRRSVTSYRSWVTKWDAAGCAAFLYVGNLFVRDGAFPRA